MRLLIKLYKEVENKMNTYDQLEYFKRCWKKYWAFRVEPGSGAERTQEEDSMETKLRKQDFYPVIIRRTTVMFDF